MSTVHDALQALTDLTPGRQQILSDVVAGLSRTPRQLPSKYFYDARGSRLFEQICELLQSSGFAASRYHAGLSPDERRQNQEDFICDRCTVMVATNAFGMGIDKSNVSFVLHYNMPKNLENYYQEAGRAGRDGERAECILLFSLGDVQTAKYFIQNSHDNDELTPEQAEAAARRDRKESRSCATSSNCACNNVLAFCSSSYRSNSRSR